MSGAYNNRPQYTQNTVGWVPPNSRKLGANPSRPDQLKRRLMFKDYLGLALPAPPPRVIWDRGFTFNWGMALNGPNTYGNGVPPDGLGDCTEGKKVHASQIWTLNNGRMYTPPDSVVLSNYELDSGYVPGDPTTDNGESMIDNLNAWRRNGFGGIDLLAYAALILQASQTFLHLQQAIWLFGIADIAFDVPQSADDQTNAGLPWDVVSNDGGILGGHNVIADGYDLSSRMIICKSWGLRQLMTFAFFEKYVTECYADLSSTWLGNRGISPSHFDLPALKTDLQSVTG